MSLVRIEPAMVPCDGGEGATRKGESEEKCHARMEEDGSTRRMKEMVDKNKRWCSDITMLLVSFATLMPSGHVRVAEDDEERDARGDDGGEDGGDAS